MKKMRLFTVILLTIGLVIFSFQAVLAVPPLPSSFYGTVKVNGANVPAGTVVSAKINGVQYASAKVEFYQGNSVYSFDVPGEDTDTPGIQGGVEGDTIHFYIGSIQAGQTAKWHTGTNVNLNLTGSGKLSVTVFLPFIHR